MGAVLVIRRMKVPVVVWPQSIRWAGIHPFGRKGIYIEREVNIGGAALAIEFTSLAAR